jgi:hypothetical protein
VSFFCELKVRPVNISLIELKLSCDAGYFSSVSVGSRHFDYLMFPPVTAYILIIRSWELRKFAKISIVLKALSCNCKRDLQLRSDLTSFFESQQQ